jgi:predicted lysophospholipase L1 biosynthesis ABC-type transport system permease subunit
MQAMTTVVGWSVNGVLTAQLAQLLPSACLLLVKAASIRPTITTAANSVFNMVNMGLPPIGRLELKPTVNPRPVTADTCEHAL